MNDATGSRSVVDVAVSNGGFQQWFRGMEDHALDVWSKLSKPRFFVRCLLCSGLLLHDSLHSCHGVMEKAEGCVSRSQG